MNYEKGYWVVIGIFIGMIVAAILFILGTSEILGSIQITNISVNIPFNQTEFQNVIERMNNTRGN